MTRRYAFGGILAAVAALLAACSAASPPTPGPPSLAVPTSGEQTQMSEGGQVTVVVAWAGPAGGAVFDVKLDTHSVDLDALDLSDAILRNDRGERLVARPWTAAKGGHHREGMLAFDGDAGAFLADVRWVEIVLSGIGDIAERTLRFGVAL